MNRFFQNKGLMKKLMLSYICILLPVLILNLIMVRRIRIDNAEQIRVQMKEKLANAVIYFDEKGEQFKQTAITLANEPVMYRDRMLDSVQNAAEGIKRLKSVYIYNPDIYEVFMVYDTSYVYSNRGKTAMNVYFEDTIKLNTDDVIRAKEYLSEQFDSMTIWQAKNGVCFIIYHFPQRIYKNHGTVSVNFVVEASRFVNSVKNILPEEAQSITIRPLDRFDKHFGTNNLSYDLASGSSFNEQTEPYKGSILHAETSYFSFELNYNENAVFERQSVYWHEWYIMIACITFLMCCLSVFFSSKHYKPIASLLKQTSLNRMVDKRKTGNEIEYIGMYIKEIEEESSILQKQLHDEQNLIKQQSATLIFNAFIVNKGQILSRMEFCGIDMESDYYAIAAIQNPDRGSLEKLDEILSRNLYYIESKNNEKVLYILICTNGIDEEGNERINKVQSLGLRQKGSVAVSEVYDDLELIAQAKLEAEHELALMTKGKDIILCRNKKGTQLMRLSAELVEAIYLKNLPLALNIVSDLKKDTDSQQSLAVTRQAVISAMAQLQLDQGMYENLSDMINRENEINNDSWQVISEIISTLCHNSPKNNVVLTAIDYINEHFTDGSLSLETVAEHCSVTPAYLSRAFKRSMRKGYIDYVSELRMQEACRLLENTDLTTSEIAQKIGYSNISSLSKRFRQITGSSLLEYREKIGKGEI